MRAVLIIGCSAIFMTLLASHLMPKKKTEVPELIKTVIERSQYVDIESQIAAMREQMEREFVPTQPTTRSVPTPTTSRNNSTFRRTQRAPQTQTRRTGRRVRSHGPSSRSLGN